jgi:hypothetical protein
MPIQSVNDFVVRFANVNGSGSASANELFARSVLRMGIFVRDISTFGAGLEILGAVTLPGIFELTFDSARTLRVCRLIWRDSECMGVQFSVPKPVVDLLNSHRLPPPDRFVLQHSRNYKS